MSNGPSSGRNTAFTALTGGLMATGGPIVLVVTAALVLTSLLAPSSSSPAPKPEEAKKDGADDKTPPSGGGGGGQETDVTAALLPLWQHLGVDATRPEDKGQGPAKENAGGRTNGPTYKRISDPTLQRAIADLNVQVMIATLPDPVETGSKYEFDMGLEAIHKAIESEGYLIDRYSNPWGNPGSKPGESRARTTVTGSNRLA